MAGNGGLDHDDPLAVGCYSQLVFAEEITGLDRTDQGCFGFSSSFSSDDNNSSPKMLCFGDFAKHENIKVESAKKSGQKSGLKCMDSSTPSSSNTLPKSNVQKKRNGSGTETIRNPGSHAGAPAGNQRTNCKKPKSNNSTATGHAKVVKKQKLGERITALQQLVSPFGKTDTASVLHEALGYIRFLQDQVQVLCSPYLQNRPPTFATSNNFDDEEKKDDHQSEQIRKDDLRSRGLCLVPMELTLNVADSNGADLWSSSNAADLLSSAVMI